MNFDLFGKNRTAIFEKIKESAVSVLPLFLTVAIICLAAVPMRPDLLLSFIIGSVMVVVGMGFFTLGAEVSMTPIGGKIGMAITKTKKMPLILIISFLLGFAVTVAEPDLQVLAKTAPHINSVVLLIAVGLGVGFFLSICMFRILAGIKLRWLLILFYGIIFALSAFSDPDFLSIAFDSGGVTTGPMTVPFILALGVGVSQVRSDEKAESDSFGLVALCSVGPILAVLILGFFYSGNGEIAAVNSVAVESTAEIGLGYAKALPIYMKEVSLSLLPIVIIFLLFQAFSLKLTRRRFVKILVGILHTYIGLVLFMTGVNVGFSALGESLGEILASGKGKWFMLPLSVILGWFIISAEPAVSVLEKQIEQVSAGAIPGKVIKRSLSFAIAAAMGISMLRVLTGISLMYFLAPGYLIAIVLSFFVPDIYTAIAFDSGGVASGPMTATFMLQFFMGASAAVGGNPLCDAFGAVAVVAMMPLISIQLVGFAYRIKCRKKQPAFEEYGDYDIVELWEGAN